MKNKITAYFITVLMLLADFTIGVAAPGDEVLLRGGDSPINRKSIETVIYDNSTDTLYAIFENSLYAYSFTGEPAGEPRVHPLDMADNQSIWRLFLWKGELYLYNLSAGKGMIIDKNNGKAKGEPLLLPTLATEEETGLFYQGVFNDQLFFIKEELEGNRFITRLWGVHLLTGEEKNYPFKGVKRLLTAGAEGDILTLGYELTNTKQKDGFLELAWFTPEEENFTHHMFIKTEGANHVAYDKENQEVYYTKNQKVYRQNQAGESIILNYLQSAKGRGNNPGWLTSKGLYIGWSPYEQLVFVKNVQEQYSSTKELTVQGWFDEKAVEAFNKRYPNMAVVEKNDIYSNSAQQIIQAIQTGDKEIDIYLIEGYNTSFNQIMKKEYALPLSASPTIKERCEHMYPYAQEGISYNGEIYGIYTELNVYDAITYFPDVWEAVGLTDDEVPQTYEDFIDICAKWQHDLADEFPQYRFSMDPLTREWLIQRVVEAYVAQHQKTGEPVNFNTALFRELMSKIEEGDFPSFAHLSQQEQLRSDLHQQEDEFNGLFGFGMPGYLGASLTLSIGEGRAPATVVKDFQLAFINPKTNKKEEAVAFLEEVVNHQYVYTKLCLYTDQNNPVPLAEEPYYLAMLTERLNTLQKELEEAQGSDQNLLKETILILEKQLEKEKANKWQISPEKVEDFQKVLPTLFIPQEDYLAFDNEEGSNISILLDYYVEGTTTLEEFISEANRRIKMMDLEKE